jgi:hypothetical protein
MDQNRQVSDDHARGHRWGKIDYPGALQTGPMGISCRINAEGEIVGGYPGTDLKIHGFLLDASGFSSIDFPNTNLTSPGQLTHEETSLASIGKFRRRAVLSITGF